MSWVWTPSATIRPPNAENITTFCRSEKRWEGVWGSATLYAQAIPRQQWKAGISRNIRGVTFTARSTSLFPASFRLGLSPACFCGVAGNSTPLVWADLLHSGFSALSPTRAPQCYRVRVLSFDHEGILCSSGRGCKHFVLDVPKRFGILLAQLFATRKRPERVLVTLTRA